MLVGWRCYFCHPLMLGNRLLKWCLRVHAAKLNAVSKCGFEHPRTGWIRDPLEVEEIVEVIPLIFTRLMELIFLYLI